VVTTSGDRDNGLAARIVAALDRLGRGQRTNRQLDAGAIYVARACLTCRFHRHEPSSTHHCTLLAIDLPHAELRLDRAEHVPAGVSAAPGSR
jgi:hypothetical protein